MRIDNRLLIAGENRTDAGDLLSRLEAGDVIKAKVLELSPQEAMLRLSDGSVIKARTNEALDVKPGQTISLSVTSRTDNSFVLETVKNASKTVTTDTGKLQKMLEAAGIKVDNTNLNLAAEFLKYNTVPTSENITKALESMKGPGGLDIEKAVYLAVKDINSGQADKDMLSGLLNGSLKLGKLLESLNKALNGETKNTGIQNAEAGLTASSNSSVTDNKSSQRTEQPASGDSKSITADKSGLSALKSSNSRSAGIETKSSTIVASDDQFSVFSSGSNQSKTLNAHSAELPKTGTDTAGQQVPASLSNGSKANSSDILKSGIKAQTNDENKTYINPEAKADIDTVLKTDPNNELKADPNSVPKNEHDAVAKTDNKTLPNTSQHAVSKGPGESPQLQKPSASLHESAVDLRNNTNNAAGHPNTTDIAKEGLDIPAKAALPEQALERIADSIEKLYVNINKQLSGDELDSGNMKNKLSELAKELNLLTHSSAGSHAVNTQAASALNTVEDTVRLLDMFNSNNVLYYQIPVKIESYRSTAELYVMKRNQNRKRIDPGDSVLFLSLDTKNMGRIETLLDVKGSNISISLRTESQAVSDFAKANIKNLYTGLSECGYKLADMRYSIIGAAATPAQQEKLLADAVRLKHGKVDFRI